MITTDYLYYENTRLPEQPPHPLDRQFGIRHFPNVYINSQPGQSRLLLLVINSDRPTLAEKQLADLSFAGCCARPDRVADRVIVLPTRKSTTVDDVYRVCDIIIEAVRAASLA